jgi:predicted anti-sigma-YlaC factor YlaD
MIEELCPMEASVLLARRTGQWTETHERHIADCANCRELLTVAGFMTGIADSLRREPALPDPLLIWLRAQWIEEERHRRYLARTAVRRALVQAGVLLVFVLLVIGIRSGATVSTETATSVDKTIFFTLAGTLALLFLGGYFMVSRWRRLLVP